MQPTPQQGQVPILRDHRSSSGEGAKLAPVPLLYHNDNPRANIENLENKAAEARTEAKRTPPNKQAVAMNAAEAASEAVKAARIMIPDNYPLLWSYHMWRSPRRQGVCGRVSRRASRASLQRPRLRDTRGYS